jgi:hypothetical protein
MNAQLRTELQSALNSIGATAPIFLSSAGPDRLFEGFVLSCLIRALKEIGALMQVRDGRGKPSNSLNLRRAPGQIYNNPPDIGFILVSFKNSLYEIHTDLRVAGTSKVLHELDICILDRTHADSCRMQAVDPNGSKVRFLCECKCYGKTLPLRIGREFLGLCTEFHARAKTIASNSDNSSIFDLARSHDRITQFTLYPGQKVKIRSFVGWLAKELEHAL